MKKYLRIITVLLMLALLCATLSVSVFASASADDGYSDSYDDEYYDEYDDSTFTPEGGRAFAIAITLIFGIIAPMIPLGYTVFLFAKRRETVEKVDYITVGLSALWILLGIGLLIIVV